MASIGEQWVGLRFPHLPTTAASMICAHALSELENTVESILPTVSTWDNNFAILSSTPDGDLALKTAFSLDEVRALYVEKVETSIAETGERRLNETHGEWYGFVDTEFAVTLLPGRQTVESRGAFLFPTWTDGILGEICWIEPGWAQQPFDPAGPEVLARTLQAYEDAWRSGDVDARLALVEDRTCSVIREIDIAGPRRRRVVAETRDQLRRAWSGADAGRVLDLERQYAIFSTYYVFAVYRALVVVAGRTVARETASLLPIGPSGKFVGELSYSMEVER